MPETVATRGHTPRLTLSWSRSRGGADESDRYSRRSPLSSSPRAALLQRRRPAGGGAGTASATPTAQPSRSGTPELRVSTVAAGLDQVWDVGFLPDGRMLVTERGGRLELLSGTAEGATVAPVAADFGDLLVRGEGGLMGMVVHPDFAQSRRFTTCQTHTEGGGPSTSGW